MKAIIYKDKQFTNVTVNQPKPLNNEVLIKVVATSLNAGDYRMIQINAGIPKSGILGGAIAGIIEAIGADVKKFEIGDSVVVDTSNSGFGGLAEFAIAKASELVKVPESVSFIDAAACPVASTTALQALTLYKPVKEDDKVLIIGSSGGVGTFIVQLAKHFEAKVTAVCSTQNIEMVKELGADVVVDYKDDGLNQIKDKFDLILAVNGAYSFSQFKRLMKPKGSYVMVGGPIKQFLKNFLLCPIYSLGNNNFKTLNSKSNPADLDKIIKLVSESKIKPVIEKVYPLDEGIDAMKTFRKGHSRGKLVIQISEDPRK